MEAIAGGSDFTNPCMPWSDEALLIVSCSSISLWSTTKKKPLFSYSVAHGVTDHVPDLMLPSSSASAIRNPRWITSIAALPYSDVFASGKSGVI